MSTIIKASDRGRSTSGVAFNFDDVRVNAETYLAKVREQAIIILTEAQRQAATIRTSAEAEGLRAAQQAADAQVDAKIAKQMQTTLPALRDAIHKIEEAKPGWLAHWERQAVHLACAIAARLIRRELRNTPEIMLDLVREALELATGKGAFRIRLHPEDVAALGKQVERLCAEMTRLGEAEIVADGNVSQGGCVVETQYGSIDQQIESQLARIEEELT